MDWDAPGVEDEEEDASSEDEEAKRAWAKAVGDAPGKAAGDAADEPEDDEEDGLPPPVVRQPKGSFQVFWEVHPSGKGGHYYYNPASGESKWQLPTGPFDVVVLPGKGGGKGGDKSGKGEPTEQAKEEAQEEAPAEEAQPAADAAAAKEAGPEAPRSPSSSSSSSSSRSSASGRARGGVGAKGGVIARLEAFKALLRERGVGAGGVIARYEIWLPRLLGEPRFEALPEDVRRTFFATEAKRLGQEARRAEAGARHKARKAAAVLLATERARELLRNSTDAAKALAAVEASNLASDERWSKLGAADRLELLEEAYEEELRKSGPQIEEAKKAFCALCEETVIAKSEAEGAEPPTFGEARRLLRAEARWKAVEPPEERQRLYAEVAAEATTRWMRMKRKLADEEDEVIEVRKRSRRAETEAELRSLLAEHVKTPLRFTWQEARVLLSGAPVPEDLEEAEREVIFNQVREEEKTRRLDAFQEALLQIPASAAAPEGSYDVGVKAALPYLGGEEHIKGLAREELRRVWEDWRRMRLAQAAEVFRAWLPQCSGFRKAATDKESHSGKGKAFEALCKQLSKDSRYKRLNAVPAERRRILAERLKEVARFVTKQKAGSDDDVDDGVVEDDGSDD